uniref:Uncharacterized protein n=1 Tax=Rhizophora mucronata TaxID=61149 RepID=A0A2P2NMB6_RHIMU
MNSQWYLDFFFFFVLLYIALGYFMLFWNLDCNFGLSVGGV